MSLDVSAEATPAVAPPPRPWVRWADAALRGLGAAIAVWAGLVLAAYGAFISAFRVGTTLVPVAVPVAVIGNAVLIWFSYRVTGHKFLGLLPGLLWVAVSFVWSSRTSEGDLVLYQSNWVASVYLLAGAATVGVCAYRMIIPRRPPPPRS